MRPGSRTRHGYTVGDGLTWHWAVNGVIVGAAVAVLLIAANLPAYRR